MPDVHVWFKDDLVENGKFITGRTPGVVRNHFKAYVAENMDCLDDAGEPVHHEWRTQIVIPTFKATKGLFTKLVVMYVVAYDYPDRMRNINERLTNIGLSVQGLMELPEGTIDLSFIKIQRPTLGLPGCWVNV